jgi:putative nucleotidyltransferase with HDIG domain
VKLTEQPNCEELVPDERGWASERLRHAELESLEALSILDTLQMSAPVGLGYVDRDFRIIRVNSILAAVNGGKVVDQIGRTLAEVVPGLWPRLEPMYQRVLDTAKTVIGDDVAGEMAGDPGHVHNWQTSLYPVMVDGEITGIGIVAVDITDQRRVERSRAERTRSLVAALTALTEVRDPYTAGHRERVAEIAVAIARELGCDPSLLEDIDLGARIHDLGKAVIPTEILSRPGKLDEAEMNLVRQHAQAGFDILQRVQFPASVADIVLQHHERLDGSGYPNHLLGNEICIGARIVAVADVVEAMASHRPYRAALGGQAAMTEIQEGAGRLYDRDVVDVCVRLFRTGQIEVESGGSSRSASLVAENDGRLKTLSPKDLEDVEALHQTIEETEGQIALAEAESSSWEFWEDLRDLLRGAKAKLDEIVPPSTASPTP